MPRGIETKRMFADELERMMESVPLAKVRVKDLCARCGVERRVFYYHFRDKYDLIAWIFDQDYRAATESASAIFTEDHLAAANRRLWARRDFYRRAFEDDSQNSIGRYLQEFDVEMNERTVKRHFGITELSGVQSFAVRHYSYGNINCTLEWLQGKIDATPQQMAVYELACMPAFLRESYADPIVQGGN